MDVTGEKLAELEHVMGKLCARRAVAIAHAQAAMKKANRDFDRVAVPLARKITRLREQMESETLTQPATRQLDTGSHDPEWSQEDIDHYYELRGARNGR